MNFVFLDLDDRDERSLARSIDLDGHPRFGTLKPNSNEVVRSLLGAPRGDELRDMIEALLEEYGG